MFTRIRNAMPRFASPVVCALAVMTMGLSSLSAVARDKDHKDHPGYVDGSAFAELAGDDSTLIEVSIHGALLKTVASALAHAHENEAIAEFIGGIISIHAVVVEDSDDDDGDAGKIAAEIAGELKKNGWDQVAKVREDGESVTVLILLDDENDDSLAGITVMVSESGGKIVFANIAGRINLSIVGKLSKGLDIPGLHHLANLDLGDSVKKTKVRKHKRE